VDVKWENGEVKEVKIRSLQGGNCRLRSYVPLKGKGLKDVKSPNTNQFFKTPEIPIPLKHSAVQSLNLKKIYEYDLSTKKGDIIEISRE
jgi:alpha-L-fucosidase 2